MIFAIKTVTMRVDGQRRNLSNFIEYATMQYLTSSQFVEKDEMNEILADKELANNLMSGLEDFKKGDYTIV